MHFCTLKTHFFSQRYLNFWRCIFFSFLLISRWAVSKGLLSLKLFHFMNAKSGWIKSAAKLELFFASLGCFFMVFVSFYVCALYFSSTNEAKKFDHLFFIYKLFTFSIWLILWVFLSICQLVSKNGHFSLNFCFPVLCSFRVSSICVFHSLQSIFLLAFFFFFFCKKDANRDNPLGGRQPLRFHKSLKSCT